MTNSYLTGANVYVGYGVEGLQFQLYDSIANKESSTQIIGNSQSGCFSNFNARFYKAQSLQINLIRGCFDSINLSYFPFLQFSYSLSQCSLQSISTTTTPESNLISQSSIAHVTNDSINDESKIFVDCSKILKYLLRYLNEFLIKQSCLLALPKAALLCYFQLTQGLLLT